MTRRSETRGKLRKLKRARGVCIFCKRKSLGSLCRRCLDVNNNHHARRAALFLVMRDFIVELAAQGHAGAAELAERLPRKAPRAYPRGRQPV